MNKEKLLSLSQKLPVYPGINGISDMFISSILVLITEREGEYHYVFQKRKAGISQGGEICFPGGGFDNKQDNSTIDTAIRETCEELGAKKENIRVIGNLNTLVSPLGTVVYAYLAEITSDDIKLLEFNKNEVESIFTLPVSFFEKNLPESYHVAVKAFASEFTAEGEEKTYLPVQELGLPEIYSKPWGGNLYKVYVYKTEYGTIWGITSRFIYDITQYLNIIE